MSGFKQKYIGTPDFYKYILKLVIPMILQAAVTNFVSLLDNMMVGQIGTAQMNGVSIANQFIFVFNISVFGAVSGPGIFGAQFYGKGDHEGQRYTFRFRLEVSLILTILAALVLSVWGEDLIMLYISRDDALSSIGATLGFGKAYLYIMLLSLLPFAIGQAYSSVIRECGETSIPMIASFLAVGINLVLDYTLIFGHFGMPQLGVKGAAIATVIAKIIEAVVMIVWAHTHPERNRYIEGIFKSLSIPEKLMGDMIKKTIPLFINEFLWAAGMSVIAQSFSVRGLTVVAARNIASVLNNLFGVIYLQLGICLGIVVGYKLGTGDKKAAKDTDNKMIFFSVFVSVLVALLLLPFAKIFPRFYNTEEEIRSLAEYFIVIQALATPLWAYTNACYFTLRSGGKTGITFFFDFVFTWLFQIPLAFILSHYTGMDIYRLFAIVIFAEGVKVIVGYFMVKSDIWIRTIVS